MPSESWRRGESSYAARTVGRGGPRCLHREDAEASGQCRSASERVVRSHGQFGQGPRRVRVSAVRGEVLVGARGVCVTIPSCVVDRSGCCERAGQSIDRVGRDPMDRDQAPAAGRPKLGLKREGEWGGGRPATERELPP